MALRNEAFNKYFHQDNDEAVNKYFHQDNDEAVNKYFHQDNDEKHFTEKKLNSFKGLKKGWHYGEGVLFEESILNRAIDLNKKANSLGFFETNAFPGINGEVMFTLYHRDYYLEFTLETDGTVTFCEEKDDEEICYQEMLSFEESKRKIVEFRKETLWKQSESSTLNTMTKKNKDLLVSPSRIQAGNLESPLLEKSAYRIVQV